MRQKMVITYLMFLLCAFGVGLVGTLWASRWLLESAALATPAVSEQPTRLPLTAKVGAQDC